MTVATRRLFTSSLAAATLLAAASALAHHGWDWAEDKQSQIDGKIESISMAPPHPSLKVKTADGKSWQVDLGNPAFRWKAGLLALAIVNIVAQHLGPQYRVAISGGRIGTMVRVHAAVSACLWLSVLIAGRWIGFV